MLMISCNTQTGQEMSEMHDSAALWPMNSQPHAPDPSCLPEDPMTSESDMAFQRTNRTHTHMGHIFQTPQPTHLRQGGH